MPLELSSGQKRELQERRSGDAYLLLATFTHKDLEAPVRVARNGEAVVSNGVTFERGWFDVELPHDLSEPPRGRISVPNIDRRFTNTLFTIRTPIRVRLQAVLASDPDTVIEDYDWLYIRGIEADAQTVSGTLDSWNFTTSLYPARLGSAGRFPGTWL